MTLKLFIKRQLQTPADQTVLTGLSYHAEMKQVLNIVYEIELAAHITKLSDMYFGVSSDKCQKLLMNFQKQMGY